MAAFPAALLATPFRALGVILARRRILAELSALDDHMLRDIGLSRHDVLSASAEPLFCDPTTRLVARAAETRAAQASSQGRFAYAALLGSTPGRSFG